MTRKRTLRANPWRYFRVAINGRNFQLLWEARGGGTRVKRTGFYTTVHVRARYVLEAEGRAMNVLHRDESLRKSVRNPRADPPRMFVDRIEELRSFRGCRIPRTGFAFYGERGHRAKP
jgi:hypothetical protein